MQSAMHGEEMVVHAALGLTDAESSSGPQEQSAGKLCKTS